MREDDFVIYSRQTGSILSTNVSGFAFALLFSREMSFYEACKLLAQTLSVRTDRVQSDFEAFFDELVGGGYLSEASQKMVSQ